MSQLDLLTEINRATGYVPCGSDRDGCLHESTERRGGCKKPAAVFVGWRHGCPPADEAGWPNGGVHACWSHANYYADAWTLGWWDRPGTGYAYLAVAPAERGDIVWMSRLDGAAA